MLRLEESCLLKGVESQEHISLDSWFLSGRGVGAPSASGAKNWSAAQWLEQQFDKL